MRWNPFCQGVPLGKSLRLFVGCNRNLHPDGIVVRPPDNPMVVCDACECPLQAQAFYQCTRDHTHGDSYDLCESCHASSSHRRHGNHDDPRYDGEPGEFRTFAFADEIEDWWNGESEESEEEEEDSESEEEEEEEGEEKEEGGRGGGGDREEKKEEEPDPAQQAAEDVDRALEQMVTSLGSLLADEEGSDSDSDSDSSGPGSEEARRAFAMIMASLGGTSDSTEESSPSSSS